MLEKWLSSAETGEAKLDGLAKIGLSDDVSDVFRYIIISWVNEKSREK